MYDLVIRNGMVVDGAGSPMQRADVAVLGDRVVEVGNIRDGARNEIDAEGHIVTPGFIDAHTHLDAQIFWDPLATPSCWHGVTTVVMGHCGFTIAPARSDARHLVTRNLERSEDIPGVALAAGIEWEWETFPDFLDVVDRMPKGVNVMTNIGHSAIRTWVMGERAFEEKATEEDLVQMERLVQEAIEVGAVGFTTSRNFHHQTADDRPVASRIADWSEVVRLVSVMSKMGAGIFEMAAEVASTSTDDEERLEYWNRVIALASSSRVPFAMGMSPTTMGIRQLNLLDSIAAAGGHPIGMTNSRGIAILLSFETQLPYDRVVEWNEFRSQPLEKQLQDLRDPQKREQLEKWAEYGDYSGNYAGSEARPPDYDIMFPVDAPIPSRKTIASIAKEQGVHPVHVVIDLALERDLKMFFAQPIAAMDPVDVLGAMRHPRTVMTFSDAGAHVSQQSDSSIQTYLLAHWVRDQQKLSIEEAVRSMTFDISSNWGLYDRGLIRPGFVADLNVIDPNTVGPTMYELVSDLPGNAKRIIQNSQGISATIVSGEVVHRNGEHTGKLSGKLLRGPMANKRS